MPFSVPGELLDIEPLDRRKKWIRGRPTRILEPSALRVQPPCPHFGACGGCHYQHISYPGQLQQKADILRETLRRVGGVNWEGPVSIHESPPFAYRNRAQWAVRREGPSSQLGYHMARASTVLAANSCPVLSPLLERCLVEMQALLAGGALSGNVVEVEAFADSADARLALNVAFESFEAPPEQLAAAMRAALPNVESILLLDRRRRRFELSGPGYIFQQAGDYRYRVSHLSFYQVNRFLPSDLLRTLLEGAQGALALDLFAGVGFFSIPLAAKFQRVIAVDGNLSAVRDLRANAEAAGSAVISRHSPADHFLRGFRETPDFVLLDPPRAGLGAESAARLAALSSREIAYLACDPATLARDLAALLGTAKSAPTSIASPMPSYAIAEMHLFDLFPQTYHIEAFVRLRRET